MNGLTRLKNYLNEKEMLGGIANNDYLILNILSGYIFSLCIFIGSQILIIPAILLCIIESCFRWIDIKPKQKKIEKILLKYELDILESSLSKLSNRYRYLISEDINIKFTLQRYILDGYAHSTSIDLHVFLRSFISTYNEKYNTVDVDNNIICNTGRRRSLGDIFLICRSYYPKCTLIQVLRELIYINSFGVITINKCNTILKYVFYYGSGNNNFKSDTEYSKKSLTMQEIIDYYKDKKKIMCVVE